VQKGQIFKVYGWEEKCKRLREIQLVYVWQISQKSVDENGIIEILDYFCK
jgi:hypothetical protein